VEEPSNVLGDGCGCCSSNEFTYRVVEKRKREDGVWEMKVLAASSRPVYNEEGEQVADYPPAYFIVWPEDKRA
jgi:uncharacterized protein YqkB